jgi:hypothetical protein
LCKILLYKHRTKRKSPLNTTVPTW